MSETQMTGLFADIFEAEKEHTASERGGKGIVGLVEISFGYKVFLSGVSNADSFFPANLQNEVEKKAALAAANAAIVASGAKVGRGQGEKQATFSIQFRTDKNTILNNDKASGWKDDHYRIFGTWTNDYNDYIRPALVKALKEAGIARAGAPIWMRYAGIPAPNKADGSMRTRRKEVVNEDGEAVTEDVQAWLEFPVQAFADEAAARAYVGDGGNAAAPVDDGSKWKDDIVAMLKDGSTVAQLADPANGFGVSAATIQKWKVEAGL